MQIRFKPLPAWPFPPSLQRPAQFTSGWTATLELLDRELSLLGAEEVIVQAGFTTSDIRLDGWPRADARTSHDGVILQFDSYYGHLSYATDQFEGSNRWVKRGAEKPGRSIWFPGYQNNLRAIGLALEALRAVDRYGVSTRGEQYRGWAALPASTGGPTSRRQAAGLVGAYIGVEADDVLEDSVTLKRAIKEARFGSHPDHGGTTEKFQHVSEAIKLLESA